MTIGAVMALIGLVDFLSAHGGSGRTPTRAWMLIAGVFLLSIGADMLKFGHLRAWATCPDPEVPPVLGSGRHEGDGIACGSCGVIGEAGARFCDQCGADLDADAAA